MLRLKLFGGVLLAVLTVCTTGDGALAASRSAQAHTSASAYTASADSGSCTTMSYAPYAGCSASVSVIGSISYHACNKSFCTGTFRLHSTVSGYGPCDSRPGSQTESGKCMSIDHVDFAGIPELYANPNGAREWCNDATTCSTQTSQDFSLQWPAQHGKTKYAATVAIAGTGYAASHLGWTPEIHWGATADLQMTLNGSPPPTSHTSLAVSISSSLGTKPLAIGAEAAETVKVTANGGSVSAISLGKGLTLSSSIAKVSSTPAGIASFALAKGASRSFVFKLKGAGVGTVNLSADAAGKTSSGKAVKGSGTGKLTVGGQPLAIDVVVKPNPLALKSGKNGLITPGQVSVVATVTNVTQSALTGVQLLSLDPEPVDLSQKLDKLAFPKGSLPVSFGTLAPGAHPSRTFKLTVTGDGDYQFRALALYNDKSAPGGNGRVSALVGEFKAVVPLLTFTSNLHRDGIQDRGGANWVKGGTSWYVGGQIKNLSATKAICVSPLSADIEGNAASVGMQDVSVYNVNQAAPPFAGLLKPGQSVPLGMAVITSAAGTTDGTLEVPVRGYIAAPGASCELQTDGSMDGAGKELTAEQTDIAKDSTLFDVHVDITAPPAPKVLKAGALEFFGGFAKASFDFYSDTALGLAAMARSLKDPAHYRKTILGFGVYDPVEVAEAVARANSEIMTATQMLTNYMKTASPAEQQAVYNFANQVMERIPNAAYNKLAVEYQAVGKEWFGELLAAREGGDADQIWAAWAKLAGTGAGKLNALWLQLLVEGAGTQMASKTAELEQASKLETAEPKTLTTSKGGTVPSGRVLYLPDLAQAWGFPEELVKKLRKICADYDVLIGARSRQTVSLELEAEGAVLKNSNFHQKTVSPIDRKYLGMGNAPQGSLAWRSFTPEGEAYARKQIMSAGLTAGEEAEALGRLNGRFAEMGEDFTHAEDLAKAVRKPCSTCPPQTGWVDAGFNADESGSAAARTSKTIWRRFEITETPIYAEDGKTVLGTLYEPYEENIAYAANSKLGKPLPKQCKAALGTALCRITGDIDLVYITDLYGAALTPDKMYKVFAALEAAGFAHTDLVTWVEQQTGAFFFPGKEGQLKGLLEGAESTVQFAPDGIERATYLAPLDQSVVTGPNSYQLTIVGGMTPPPPK